MIRPLATAAIVALIALSTGPATGQDYPPIGAPPAQGLPPTGGSAANPQGPIPYTALRPRPKSSGNSARARSVMPCQSCSARVVCAE